MKQHITVTDEDGIVRIDKFLSQKFPEYSRAAITKLFDIKLIKRNGIPLKPGERVHPGTEIEYDVGPLTDVPEVVPLPVLYEDSDIIVVNKPVGIISHARGRFWQEASVASFIRDKVTQEDNSERAGIVHRLDRATSGVMVCAKNPTTMKYLQKQFHDRKVQKTYVAIVPGALEHAEATIEAPIMRNLNDPKRFMVHADGKYAVTDYTVTKVNNQYSMVILTPKTGRTHQIRLHMLHLGKAIVGDELYGGETAQRMMLHARSLTISVSDGVDKTFEAPLPAEFNGYLT